MKTAVKYERRKGAVKILDIDEPKINPSAVLIKVKSVAVCGSDLHAYEFLSGYQIPRETKIPLTMGHEWSGAIVKGSNVSRYRPGVIRVFGGALECEIAKPVLCP